MAANNTLSAGNDFAFLVHLTQKNATTFRVEPLTTGNASAFLAVSNASDAAALSGTTITGTHISNGWWGFVWESTTLTTSFLSSNFTGVTPYGIITHDAGKREYMTLAYADAKAATIDT